MKAATEQREEGLQNLLGVGNCTRACDFGAGKSWDAVRFHQLEKGGDTIAG